jgi:predicted kinase
VSRTAFRLLHRDLERRLATRRTTVVDATNVTAFARRSLVAVAARHAVPAIASVLDLPADLVLARNAARAGRVVPELAVQRQLADLDRSLRRAELAADGFSAVHRVTAPEQLDAVRLDRTG